VEVTSSNPVSVAFSTHDQVSIRDGPEFPGGIVGGSGYDVFLRVVADGSNAHQVTLKRFLVAKVRSYSFVAFI